jgi:serine/threonine protein kinase
MEAEAIGRLQHPNVVQVHLYGESAGIPFLCMEYVEGENLHQALRKRKLSAQEIAATLKAIAAAVEYSHSRHVLHRDLKPSNVLLSAGAVKLTDFGLAKLADSESPHSRFERVVGTASYMAPEQADHTLGKVDARTDVYGLGAILYEMLTGVPPFKAETRAETLESVRKSPVVRPRTIRSDVDRGLEAICLKCLQKRPGDRYQSAAEVLDELARWEQGLPVRALSRTRRFTHPRMIRRLGIAVLSILLVLAAALVPYLRSSAYAVKTMQNDLRAGRTVNLLSETGHPRNEDLPLGAVPSTRVVQETGIYTVSTWDYCLIELLPDPGVSEYLFVADVKHTQSAVGGEVGLYVGRHGFQQLASDHTFVQLAYNDIRSHREILQRLPPDTGPHPYFPNAVSLSTHLLRKRHDGMIVEMRASGVAGPLFEPSGFIGGPWRRLSIRVSPASIDAIWDGQSLPPFQTSMAKQALQEFTGRDHSQLQHAGIGLYVCRGAASFRNVTITPQ